MEASVKQKFDSYPQDARAFMSQIIAAILEVARDQNLGDVEETLKWNQLSYLVKGGSTVRVDWLAKSNQCCVYFTCKTLLVETFKEVYGDTFDYQGNRAIVFELSSIIPLDELKHCLSMALRYHKIKHLPLLGA